MIKKTTTITCDYCGVIVDQHRLRMTISGTVELPRGNPALDLELDFCNFACASLYVARWNDEPQQAYNQQRAKYSSDEHGPDIP